MRVPGLRGMLQLAGPAALVALTASLLALGATAAEAALLYLLAVLLAATVGGLWSGAATSVLGTVLLNYFFLPPLRTLTIAAPDNWVALFAFLIAAVVGSQLVARARARSAQAEARAEQTRRLLGVSERVLARVAGTSDVREALEALARACGEGLGTERALIALWGPDGLEGLPAAGRETGWPPGGLQQLRAACASYPDHPVRLAAPRGGQLLVLPLARRSERPALLLACLDAPVPADLAEAVGGLGSLALERLLLLHRITEAEAAKQSDALKSALLSSVSHELRTPLAAIRVAATALQREEVWEDAAGRDDLLRTVDEEAERLNRLIANLLCMSRIESGPLSLDRHHCAADTLIWEGMRQAGLRLEDGRVRLVLPEDLPEVDVELGLGGIALANLLVNAVKYSPPQAPIDVGGRLSADGCLVAIWVDDRGPGVPAGESERIFERFYRVGAPDGMRVRASGTGLGLSIARALVEAHGGRVWAEARSGGGSRFTATWPVAARAGVPAAGVAPSPQAVGR